MGTEGEGGVGNGAGAGEGVDLGGGGLVRVVVAGGWRERVVKWRNRKQKLEELVNALFVIPEDLLLNALKPFNRFFPCIFINCF
ncbi:2 3 4 5-tetrahydropyridine-2 6-dicarboxylate N-succinyltransferase [Bienertia sinuspersici]